MKKTAILLTVHNRRETTLRCLESVYRQPLPEGNSIEVFLTDDGCTDGTGDAIREKFPQVNIIVGDGNLYWNRGMIAAWNAAAKKDKYDYFLWLNDDVILKDDAIKRLLECGEKTEGKSCIVGSCHAVGNENVYTYGGNKNNMVKLYPYDSEIRPCKTFSGNIVLVPYKVYEKLGTHDPYFTHTLSDYDYGYRATEAGFINYIAPGYYGECNRHERLSKWMDPKIPFKERWKDFHSPLNVPPRENFYYRMRHSGIISAIGHFISPYLHLLFPRLWIISGRVKLESNLEKRK